MGTLYIVPTPVGNMEDMTMRAIRVLKEADLVLAEDTRTSSVLLKHFDIKNRLVAHHKFNEHGTSAAIVERLKAGETIALISGCWNSGYQRSGFYLAREAAKAGITVQTLPGTYGLHSCHRLIGFALRPLLLRGIYSAEKGETDLSGVIAE